MTDRFTWQPGDLQQGHTMTDERTIPADFEQRVAAVLRANLANVPAHLDQQVQAAVSEVLTYSDWPTVPDHLIDFDESRYLDKVRPDAPLRGLRTLELWRQDQDRWGHVNRVDRARFEQLRDRQLAERKQQPSA